MQGGVVRLLSCTSALLLAILDIPVYKSRIQPLHLLFSLYSEFKNSQVSNPSQALVTQLEAFTKLVPLKLVLLLCVCDELVDYPKRVQRTFSKLCISLVAQTTEHRQHG